MRAVEDVLAIQNLKSRYANLTDQRYDRKGIVEALVLQRLADEIAELFTEDAVWDGGATLGECRGRPAIRERFLKPTLRFSWHYFVKPDIRVDGDRASARWDILAPCTAGDGQRYWMAGTEDDEYERVDGQWLHSSMRLGVVFMAPFERGWGAP